MNKLTINDLDTESAIARSQRTDAVCQELSEIVCKEGPDLLTVGMTNLEANEAILKCIKKLVGERDSATRIHKEFKKLCGEEFDKLYREQKAARKVIDSLTEYNVGMSFLSEEPIQVAMAEYEAARNQ